MARHSVSLQPENRGRATTCGPPSNARGLLNALCAAGSLLVQEAGGLVGNFIGNEGFLDSGNIVAANPKIFSQMLQVIAPHLPPELKI